jgi:hypothetical protein
MPANRLATWLLVQEARGLLMRLGQMRPYALNMPMVTAAAVSPAAQTLIERHMLLGRRRLRAMVRDYVRWLRTPVGSNASPAEAQRRFSILRLKFNNVISQFEIFKDVFSQRSEHGTGVWVAGLDDVAADALQLDADYYVPPPVICYVDRGHGAAIRRARTRLPGGDPNPVAVIKVPRERMVGSGIASSLVHEVGHQGAALLDLVDSLQPELQRAEQESAPEQRIAWTLWRRWISEIVADFWSVAKVGISSSLGLMAVVSLPRVFVFRIDTEDPHPAPWIRMMLSCAIGRCLYPHPQWDSLAGLWESFYPLDKLDAERRQILAALIASIPRFVELLAGHRPKALQGKALREVMGLRERQPARLSKQFALWRGDPEAMREEPPTLVFAAIGQARADGKISPESESRLLGEMLTLWAVDSAMDVSSTCGPRSRERVRKRARLVHQFTAA